MNVSPAFLPDGFLEKIRQHAVPLIVMLLLRVIAYHEVPTHSLLINWDDQEYITKIPAIRGFYLREEFILLSELLRLQRESYRRFYLRPRYNWRRVINTCSWQEFSSKMQGALRLLR